MRHPIAHRFTPRRPVARLAVAAGALVLALAALAPGIRAFAGEHAVEIPPLKQPSDAPAGDDPGTAVLAGGCFWGMEMVFQHVKGVTDVVSGYAGGSRDTAQYEIVSSGTTGHAESVKITYDPSRVTYAQLLRIYFSVAHDPTQLNRQGPDVGKQYRSDIFYANAWQKREAEAYIAQLKEAHVFEEPIVTRVDALDGFYPAEAYHQNFGYRHPNYPYIVINDAPKVKRLQKTFPALYRDKPVIVATR